MKLYWTHLWRSLAYQLGTAQERRIIEIRFTAAHALRSKRQAQRITQCELARRLGAAQSTISRVEQASDQVSLDHYVSAMIALDASDEEIAAGINPGLHRGIAQLRERAALKFAKKPAATPSAHRLRRWGIETRFNSFVG